MQCCVACCHMLSAGTVLLHSNDTRLFVLVLHSSFPASCIRIYIYIYRAFHLITVDISQLCYLNHMAY